MKVYDFVTKKWVEQDEATGQKIPTKTEYDTLSDKKKSELSSVGINRNNYQEIKQASKSMPTQSSFERIGKNIGIYGAESNPAKAIKTVGNNTKNYVTSLFKESNEFKDGYDFGDITKTIIGTGITGATSFTKGILGIGEGIGDLITYGEATVAKKLGYTDFAESLKSEAQRNLVDEFFSKSDDFWKKHSITSDKGDELVQSLGYMYGTAAVGGVTGGVAGSETAANVGTYSTIFANSMGNGMTEAYQNGATDSQAYLYGTISGASEVVSELMFSGLGVGSKIAGYGNGSGVEEQLAKQLSKRVNNILVKNLIEGGVLSASEGVEEIVSGLLSAVGKKLTYMSEEDIMDLIEDENLFESFLGGALSAGMSQGKNVVRSTRAGQQLTTGFTNTDQKIIDNEVKSRIEASEKKLTRKQKNEIRQEVEEAYKNGELDVGAIRKSYDSEKYDTYKTAMNEYEAMQRDYNANVEELSRLKEENSKANIDRINELESINSELRDRLINSEAIKLRDSLDAEIMVNNENSMFIRENYENYSQRKNSYEYDSEGKSEIANKWHQSIKDNGGFNTKAMHRLAEAGEQWLSKLDKGKTLEAANTNKMKQLEVEKRFNTRVENLESERGYSLTETEKNKLKQTITEEINQEYADMDAKGINKPGMLIDGDNIYINIEAMSNKYATLLHESLHTKENAKSYKDYQDTLYKFAEKYGIKSGNTTLSFEDLKQDIIEKYGLTDLTNEKQQATLDSELTARLSEELLGNEEFVREVAKNKTTAEKILQTIKDLITKFTGTPYAKDLREVEKLFEQVLNEESISDEKGIKNAIVQVDEKLADNLTEKQWKRLEVADKLLRKGYHPDYVYSKTGYQKNGNILYVKDLELTRYIDFSKQGEYNFADYLDGDILENFPKFKNYKIFVDDLYDIAIKSGKSTEVANEYKRAYAATVEDEGIVFNTEAVKDFNNDDIKNIMSHEIQHLIDEEQFGKKEVARYYDVSDDKKIYTREEKIAKYRTNPKEISAEVTRMQNAMNSNERKLFPIDLIYNEVYNYYAENSKHLDSEKFIENLKNNYADRLNEWYNMVEEGETNDRPYRWDRANSLSSDNFGYNENSKRYRELKSKTDNPNSSNSGIKIGETEIGNTEENKQYSDKITGSIRNDKQGLNYSIKDNKGRSLTKEQQDFFSESKTRDDEGNLITYYNGGDNFTVFDKQYMSDQSKWGKGIYLTKYEDISHMYGGDVKEVYANITNPVNQDEKTISFEQYNNLNQALWDEEGYIEEYDMYDNDLDLLWDVTNKGNWADYAEQIKEHTGKDGLIINDDVRAEDMAIAFQSNQIKNVDNLNPTENEDIRYSIRDNVEANEQKAIGDLTVKNDNPKLKEQTNEFYDGIPLRQAPEIDNNYIPEELAPVRPEQVSQKDMEEVFGETNSEVAERNFEEVGNRSVKSYQYEHPEVKKYFQPAARDMLVDLKDSVKGERIYTDEAGWMGNTRQTTSDIAELLDYGYTYDDIEKGLNAILKDHGAENIAVAKRIELALDNRLMNGYTDTMGYEIPANEDYKQFMNQRMAENEYEEIAPIRQNIGENVQDDYLKINNENKAVKMQKNTISEAKNDYIKLSDEDMPTLGERRWTRTATESDAVRDYLSVEDLDLASRTYEVKSNRKTTEKADAKFNALGYEDSIKYFESQLANSKVSVEDIALGQKLIKESLTRGDTRQASELIQDIAIIGTELGQQVQALSLIQKMTPEGQVRMIEKAINRGKTTQSKVYEGVEFTQEMKDKILSTYNSDGSYDQQKLTKSIEEVKQDLANQMKATVGEKARAWRYLSMLGNPKTHIRNMVSNVAMQITKQVKDVQARTIETILGDKLQERTKTWARASEYVKDFAETTTEEMKEVISGGKYSEMQDILDKRKTFKNKVLEWISDTNSKLLEAEDWWFSKATFKSSLQEFLTANGIRTEQDILENPELVEKAKMYAVDQAQIATFRQYSKLASQLNNISKSGGVAGFATDVIMPFKKTPINVAKAGVNYSALGLVKTLSYDTYRLSKGEITANQYIDNLCQGTTGTGLMMLGYMLAQAGILSGAGDDDKEAKYDSQLGSQTYAVNVGGKSYSLSWLSPVAMPLFVGANFQEQEAKIREGGITGDMLTDMLATTLDPMTEMSFISSFDDIMTSYSYGGIKGVGEDVVQNYLGQYLPTFGSQIAATMDDTKRSTAASKDASWKFGDETYRKLAFKIPGLRETLEPSIDIWGNEVKQDGNIAERAFNNFIAPYTAKGRKETSVDKEIQSVYDETGDTKMLPNTSPNKYIKYGDEKYNMSAKDYTQYKKTLGSTSYDMLEELFESTSYKRADATDKSKMIEKVMDYSKEKSKSEFLDKKGVDYTEDKSKLKIKGAIDNDMGLDEYSYYKENPSKYTVVTAIASYDDYQTYKTEISNIRKQYSGYTTEQRKAAVREYINTLNLEPGQKLMLEKMAGGYSIKQYRNYIIAYLNSSNMSNDDRATIYNELFS